MAKQRLTKKSGPSKRPRKRDRERATHCEFGIHENLRLTFLRISDYKGGSNQTRFELIFTGDFPRPSWYVGIRRATKHEDSNEGTDFFIITDHYGEIRFDVKSSFSFYEKQKRRQEGKPIFVWCVVVKSHFSDEQIRRIVFEKCEIHIAKLRRSIQRQKLQRTT